MSLFRSSRYRLAPALPNLQEIQYTKFYELLTSGMVSSLQAINPIQFRRKNLRVVLYPDVYYFIRSKMTERQALATRKSYTIALYVAGHLFLGDRPLEKPQWIFFGHLPMMTRRGDFVINGITRVLVHQIVRRPGVHFKEKIEGTGVKKKRLLWADFICQRGSWVRIQRDKRQRLWFCLKNMPKVNLDHVIGAMEAVEARLQLAKPFSHDALIDLGLVEARLGIATSKYKEGDGAFTFLYTRFKNPKVYNLGVSARYQLNRKLDLNESSLQLTSGDLKKTRAYLLNLDQNQRVPDDIDNLSNRRVRTSSEIYQGRLDTGFMLLAKNVRQKLQHRKRLTTAAALFDPKPLNQVFRECFLKNPLSQFLNQLNPLADVTHKRRIYATGPGGINPENASLAMRSIHPTHYGRICPIETPEGKRAGLVNSLTVFGRVDAEGFMQTPYYHVFRGQIQTRSGVNYVTSMHEQDQALTIAPLDLGRDRGQAVSGMTPVPARIATELQEDFVSIPRDKVEYIGLAPAQLMSIATSLIPFLEHNDANRALMGSNMQRQTVPVLRPTRPIVSTGLESVVVGESGHALIADKAGLVSYVSGDVIHIDSWEKVVSDTLRAEGGALSVPSKGASKGDLWRRSFEEGPFRGLPCTFSAVDGTPSTTLSKEAPLESKEAPLEGTQQWIQDMTQNWLHPQSLHKTLKEVHGRALSVPWTESPSTRTSGSLPSTGRQQYNLQTYDRSNQGTAMTQRPMVQEGQWVQPGDLIADCAASVRGHLALGHNLCIAYVPWEGYNFEDAVVISERLIFDDLFTTLHIEKYETSLRKKANSVDSSEIMTKDLLPVLSKWNCYALDADGIIRVGLWVEPGDVLVRKIIRMKPKPINPYMRLAMDILERKPPTNRDVSFRVPRGIRGRVINTQVLERVNTSPQIRAAYTKAGMTKIPKTMPSKVRVFVAEKRRIQVGDKVAGRHGNKGIVSTVLPRQDMPYLPDGRTVDMVLNPLGVPSRMNVGQVFECLLGLAGTYLNQEFRITPFDEMFGAEASRSIVFLKLYQARLKTKKKWLFQPNFPGKVRVFDGRTGDCFDQFVTVGCAYMLKLVHLVEEKIHARTVGPYTMIMEQPMSGRSKRGGQRLGEMEVWALEAYGAAYILQEMLTIKSDDFEGRTGIVEHILDPVLKLKDYTLTPDHLSLENLKDLHPENVQMVGGTLVTKKEGKRLWANDFRYKSGLKFGLGTSDAFRVLVRELQSLCLDVGVYGLMVPLPKNQTDYCTWLKKPFEDFNDNESELPIRKEAVQLCDPLSTIGEKDKATYHREYSRQYKSQFDFDF